MKFKDEGLFKVRRTMVLPRARKKQSPIAVAPLEQGSDAWHRWRQTGIGASEAPAIMNASPWCTPQKLWEIKTKRRLADPQTWPMRMGLKMEPVARARYEDMTGIEMPKDVGNSKEFDFIKASYDGINKKVGKVLEIKCPGREDHATALKGKIPDKYLWQCVQLLFVSELDQLDYFSFDGEDGVIVPFGRDKKLEAKLLEKEIPFWECVQNDVPPIERKLVMPNERPIQTNGAFTKADIIEIMQEAKRLGVTLLKFQGQEFAFGPQAEEPTRSMNDRPICKVHDEEFIDGKYKPFKPYCKSCWIEKKEAEENKNGRGSR